MARRPRSGEAPRHDHEGSHRTGTAILTPLVVDASVALAWCFPDERTAETDRLRHVARTNAVVVPPHFPIEVANVLASALRRKKLSLDDAALFAELLRTLDLRIAGELDVEHIASAARDAQESGLTVYDWLYVSLAESLHGMLATLDGRLAEAARRRGVHVVELG